MWVFRRKLAAWPVWTFGRGWMQEGRVRNAAPRLRVDRAVERRIDRRPVDERVRAAAQQRRAEQLRGRPRRLAVDADGARRDAVDRAAHRDAARSAGRSDGETDLEALARVEPGETLRQRQ